VVLLCRSDIWTAINRFSHRVSLLDKTMFLTRDVVNVVTKHFRDIRHADCRYMNCKTHKVSFAYFVLLSLTDAVVIFVNQAATGLDGLTLSMMKRCIAYIE